MEFPPEASFEGWRAAVAVALSSALSMSASLCCKNSCDMISIDGNCGDSFR